MATAAELLAAAMTSGESADDRTLVIDNDLRTIHIPSSVYCLGVENDDDVLRLEFRMPRYFGEIDLSTFAVRINYLNAKAEGDVYIVDDLAIVGGNLTFSWLVGPTATKYKGNTKFNICMKVIDADAYVQKEFNTTIATLPVLEGLEVEEGVVEYYSDVLEQWRRQLFGIGATEEANLVAKSEEEQEKIANKGIEVLGTIPEDYRTTYNLANNAYRTRANAILGTAQGESIVLDDSSGDPLRGLRIFGRTTRETTTGKNLFDVVSALANQKRGTTPANDYTAYTNGVRVTSNGYDNGRAYMYLTLDAGTYNISANVSVGGNWNFSVKNYDTNTELINIVRASSAAISHSFTIDTSAQIGFCFMSVVSGGPATTATDIQLEFGSVATDYEPYSGGVASPSPEWPQAIESVTDPTVEIYGRNLLGQNGEYESGDSTRVLNAVVDNGVVSVSGTSMLGYGTLRTAIPLGVFKKGLTYRISRVSNNFHVGFWFYDKNDVNIGSLTTENSLAYTVPEHVDHMSFFYAGLTPGVEVNLTEKFMLNLGTEALPWEPCVDAQSIAVPHTLAAIPVTADGNYIDADGRQWICDEIDFESGWYIQRIGKKTFTGEETWLIGEQNPMEGYHGVFYTGMPDMAANTPAICSHFVQGNSVGVFDKDGQFDTYYSQFRVNIGSFTSVDEWCEYLRSLPEPLTLYYILKMPVSRPLSAKELAAFGALHTNYPNTTVINDSGAGMEVKYNEDLKFYTDEIMQYAAETVITQAKIQSAVDNWLSAHYSSAEGVSF